MTADSPFTVNQWNSKNRLSKQWLWAPKLVKKTHTLIKLRQRRIPSLQWIELLSWTEWSCHCGIKCPETKQPCTHIPVWVFLYYMLRCQSCCWQDHCKKSRSQSSFFIQDYRDPIPHVPCTRKSHWAEINRRVDSKMLMIEKINCSTAMLPPPAFIFVRIFMWNIPLNPLTRFIKSGSRFDGSKVC